jgi:hypothetical protein
MLVTTVSERACPAEESEGAHWLLPVAEWPAGAYAQSALAIAAAINVCFIFFSKVD